MVKSIAMVTQGFRRSWQPLTLLARTARLVLYLMVLAALMGGSALPPGNRAAAARAFTRDVEFDFVSWTLKAFGVKLKQLAVGDAYYLSAEARRQAVLDYLNLVNQTFRAEAQLNDIYGDPEIADPQAASADLRRQLDDLSERRSRLGPVAEAVVQGQIADIVGQIGLGTGGQPLPPVLYHSTPLPLALIISPRSEIRQEMNISLDPTLTVDQHITIEEQVDQALDVSSLVVRIGGVGLYPTMVQQTTDLNWLTEVVAHEWIHNFLTLRPLGINYLKSPELRTMNETAATIAGKEIGRAVMERYYPDLLPPPPAPVPPPATPPQDQPPAPPAFDFIAEMRTTRLRVDELLEQGKIEEAEAYMEERRVIFWENGYHHLRKLNQAYFAFHGAYADDPRGGAAGDDPVGAAVRKLRQQSSSLTDFLRRIAVMSSFEQLQRAVAGGSS